MLSSDKSSSILNSQTTVLLVGVQIPRIILLSFLFSAKRAEAAAEAEAARRALISTAAGPPP